MSQVPLLDANERKDPYEIVLARDITRFNLEYGPTDDPAKEFSPDFFQTNALPKMVRITLGIGHSKNHYDQPSALMIRIVSIPCDATSGQMPF
jgi:hypothetical protein